MCHIDHKERIDIYEKIKQFLDKHSLFYIDLNDHLHLENISELLYDGIHTTEYGASRYADIIWKEFLKKEEQIVFPTETKQTTFSNIKELPINKIFHKQIKLIGTCRLISIEFEKNKHCGFLFHDENNKFQLWDRWCYFVRLSITNLDIDVQSNITLIVLQDNIIEIDEERNINYDDFNKYVNVQSFYYIPNEKEDMYYCEFESM